MILAVFGRCAGSGCTLGSGAWVSVTGGACSLVPGGTSGDIASGSGSLRATWSAKMEESFRSASRCAVASEGWSVGPEGVRRAEMMSLAAAMRRSLVDGVGMRTWVGSHVRVSMVRSAPVSDAQTR